MTAIDLAGYWQINKYGVSPFPNGFRVPASNAWDTDASILNPTRKPYWHRIKYIGDLSAKQVDAALWAISKRWNHEEQE